MLFAICVLFLLHFSQVCLKLFHIYLFHLRLLRLGRHYLRCIDLDQLWCGPLTLCHL